MEVSCTEIQYGDTIWYCIQVEFEKAGKINLIEETPDSTQFILIPA
jgi:hypothetical protein